MQKNNKYVLNLEYYYDIEAPYDSHHFSKKFDTYEEAKEEAFSWVEDTYVKWWDINETEV